MNVFELVAKLTLDSSEYESGLKNMRADIDKKASSIKKSMLAITGAGVAALGAFAVSSVKTGAEFDKSMSQVAATMGMTVDEIGELRDFAQEMGASTAFSATQAADALNYMALAGYDAKTSMQMLPTVLDLAAAGGIDLARASDMVTDAQSALGLTLEETKTMVDQMAAASSKSNTSVEQLGDAFLTVGATARGLKGGTQEMSTVLGVLADNGIKGAEGGTHLRNAILSLQTPTKDGTEALAKLGMTYKDMYDEAGNLRSLPEIFQQMSGAMEGMTQQSKDAIISGIFNKTDLAAVNALLGTTTERWDELGTAIADSAGAAERMADTQLDNLSGDITLMKSAFEGLQISISDKLTPAIRKVVQSITKMIENFDTVGPIVAGVAVAFGTLAVAVNIGAIIKSVTTSFAALNAVLAANPIGIVIALIAGLVTAIVLLWNNNEEFRNKVIEIWGNIKDVITEVVEAVSEFLSVAWESIKTTAIAAWDVISQYAGVAWGVIQAIWSAAAPYFQAVWDTIAGIFSVVASVFQGDFQGAWDAIKGIIDTWAGYFGQIWDDIKAVFDTALDLGKDIVDKIWQGVQSGWSSFKDWVAGAWEGIKSLFTIDIKWPFGGGHGHAIGLDYVPSNNYQAVLHRGEAVLTAHEAEEWRRGGSGRASSQPIQVNVSAPVVLDGATVARQTYSFFLNLDDAHGVSLINA